MIDRLSFSFCLLIKRYDPSTQRWSRVTSMGTKRLGVAVAVLDGHLYAIGGSDGQSPLNTGKIIFERRTYRIVDI